MAEARAGAVAVAEAGACAGAGWAQHAAYLPAGAAAGFLVGVAEGIGAVGGEVAGAAGDAVRFVVNVGALGAIVGAAVGLVAALISFFTPVGAGLGDVWRRVRGTPPAVVSAAIFVGATGVALLFVASYVVSKTIVDLSRREGTLALVAAGTFLVWAMGMGVTAASRALTRWRMPRPRIALLVVLGPVVVLGGLVVRAERDRIEAMPLGAYLEVALVVLLPVVFKALWRWRAVRRSVAGLAVAAGAASLHLAIAFSPMEALHLEFHGKLSREVLQRVAFLRPSAGGADVARLGEAAARAGASGARAASARGTSARSGAKQASAARLSGAAAVDSARARSGPVEPPRASAAVKVPDGLSVVLITVDTLRADRLGCYGYGRPTSPQIDRLAASGVRFERAYSTASLTSHAIPPMLTSRYISEMNRTFEHFVKFTPDNVGFPSLLQKAGIRTVGLTSHWYLAGKSFGFSNGFDVWDTSAVPSKAYEVDETSTSEPLTRAAQKQLAAIEPGKRFLLWIHYLDPHKSFLVHPGFPSFGKSEAERYDGEVAYTDHFIGELLDTLAKRPDAQKIAVVFLADHGEGLGNHNHMHHGWNAFEELVRIPLIIMAPGAAPRVLPGPASILDVAPTILDMYGVAVPRELRGRSLAPYVWGKADTEAERPVLIDMPKGPTNPFIRALLQSDADGDWKLIFWADRKVYQLFNLRDDPKELQNLTRREKTKFAAMKAELDRWFTKELQIRKARGAEDEEEATEP